MSHEQNMEKIKNKLKNWLCLSWCEAGIVLCSGGEQSVLLLGSVRRAAALAQPMATLWRDMGGTAEAVGHQGECGHLAPALGTFAPWCFGLAEPGFGSGRAAGVASVRSS